MTVMTVAAVVLIGFVVMFAGLYRYYRGKRIVTCPETQAPAGAQINAALAAGSWMVTQPRLIVTSCSRWPERAGCDQACATQIEESANETLVRNIVAKWYGEHECVYCAQPIGDVDGAIAPALLEPDNTLREWNDIAAEDLPLVLAHAVAVCARCALAEDFRRHFLHRVIDRPNTPLRQHAALPTARHLVVEPPSQAVY
jgi:hypothetical protein